MNRRGFITGLAAAVAGFAILPSAMTYKRSWKQVNELWVPNPEWEKVDHEVYFMFNQETLQVMVEVRRLAGCGLKPLPGAAAPGEVHLGCAVDLALM